MKKIFIRVVFLIMHWNLMKPKIPKFSESALKKEKTKLYLYDKELVK